MTSTPHNVDNYAVLKGIVYVKVTGVDDDYRDAGNAPKVSFNPKVELLEHFSSREGIKVLDLTVAKQATGELKLTLEEITAENMALHMLGSVETSGEVSTIKILSTPQIRCAIKIVGTNDVGAMITAEFPNCTLTPNSAFEFITDEWGNIEVSAAVYINDDGSFGTITMPATTA